MKSLNQILKQIEEVAESHYQINTYAQGQRYDFSADAALLYPCLWAVPAGVTPSLERSVMDYRIIIVMMDIEKADGSNEIDILNDTALILMDVIAKLQELAEEQTTDEPEWNITSVGGFEPFVDAQLDTVSGHTCELVITAFFASDLCVDIFSS
jgi:hypothetical protein